MRLLSLAFAALLSALLMVGRGADAQSGSFGQFSTQIGGVTRTFWALVPPGLDPDEVRPVIFALHGGSGTAEAFLSKTGLVDRALSEGFVLIAPQGLDGHWRHADATSAAITPAALRHAGDDLAFLAELGRLAVAQFRGDPARFYGTGVSAGGMMLYRLACQEPEGFQLRAIAVVASAMTIPETECPFARGTSLLHMHGDADTRVPLNGGPGGGIFAGVVYPPAGNGSDFFWAANGCMPEKIFVPFSGVTEYRTGCPRQRQVVFDHVRGGTHDWDLSSGFSETGHVVAFLLSH